MQRGQKPRRRAEATDVDRSSPLRAPLRAPGRCKIPPLPEGVAERVWAR
ncbi:hypothetical protein ACMHYB_45810 [Sorangium sp. So ce1128]